MHSLALGLAVFAVALPAAAQPASPDTALTFLWGEVQGGVEAVGWGIDHALYEDSVAAVERPEARAAAFRRGIVVASHAAAAAGGTLSATLQMAIALAEPARQAEVEAGLGEPAAALYYALAAVVDEAADVAERDGPPDAALREAWRQHAAVVRLALGFLRDASTALPRDR